MSGEPDRELRAEVRVEAPPSRVWEVLADLTRMPAWSPELVRVLPLGLPGRHGDREPRAGRQFVGLNRRGAVVWPTRNRVVAVEPERLLAWDTVSSGARWIFELCPDNDATRVVQRRPVTVGLTLLSRGFAAVLLGGSSSHADELEAGMRATLGALRDEVQSSVPAGG
jgi:uncharacterized protein YndB with AHSA1/START domain